MQETRHWDEDAGTTASMRSKEEAFDYRYFPEPDIPPLEPDPAWVDEIRATLPELPRARRGRLRSSSGSGPRWRGSWSPTGPPRALRRSGRAGADPAPARPGSPRTSRRSATPPERRAPSRRGTSPTSSAWFPRHRLRSRREERARGLVRLGREITEARRPPQLRQVSDTGALGALADEVIHEHPDVVEKFRGGKDGVIGFLVGQLMQKAAGREPEGGAGAPAGATAGIGPVATDPLHEEAAAPPAVALASSAWSARSRVSSCSRCSGCGSRPIRSMPTGSTI